MKRLPPFSDEMVLFRKEFCAIQGDDPFPWQERLFEEFCCGTLPPALDLTTGLLGGPHASSGRATPALSVGSALPSREPGFHAYALALGPRHAGRKDLHADYTYRPSPADHRHCGGGRPVLPPSRRRLGGDPRTYRGCRQH